MPRAKSVVLLLLASVLTLDGKVWGADDAPQNQNPSSHLASVRTFALAGFRTALLDRLSGGLDQDMPYRMATDSRGRVLVTDPFLSLVHVFDVTAGKRWQIKIDPWHHRSRRCRIISCCSAVMTVCSPPKPCTWKPIPSRIGVSIQFSASPAQADCVLWIGRHYCLNIC